MTEDIVLNFMKQRGVPLTRENYLHIAYMGAPPEDVNQSASRDEL
jgi:hypothetical protein